LLNSHDISVRDWGGTSYVLQDAAGRRENVYNLAGIWAQIHEMLGTALDPLAPDLLAATERSGNVEQT
jgi:hypothetical protein